MGNYLRIDRNFCSVHEEITSMRLYTPCNQPQSGCTHRVTRYATKRGLHAVYNLIEVISNESNK